MAPRFLPVADLPHPGDLVWCKFPKPLKQNEKRVSRPVLVRDSEVRRHPDGYDYGVVAVTYGTGADGHGDPSIDLLIGKTEFRSLGLHKPTIFILDKSNTKTLLWRDDFFIPPGYILNQGLFIGRLDDTQWALLNAQAAKPRP